MTDRLSGVLVVFEAPIREDDAEQILNAIRCIKGVTKVEKVFNQGSDYAAVIRERMRIYESVQATLTDACFPERHTQS